MLPDLAGHEDAVSASCARRRSRAASSTRNVVEVYDIGHDAATSFYMVMELLEGESLAARLATRAGCAPAEACRILLPCMRGVARAHAAGIVHRDLKPANIFLCRAPRASTPSGRRCSTSASRRLVPGSDAQRVGDSTKTGAVHRHAPLHVARAGARPATCDHRTDVYAFGVILYELLSGKLPFEANTYGALVLQIVLETPEPLQKLAPELAPGFIKIVNQAMARNAAERFQSLEAMAAQLEPYAAGVTPRPDPSPYASAIAPPRRVSHRPNPLRVPQVSVETPLSSEFDPELPTERRSGRGLVWTALLAGLALVLGGGFVALRMTGWRAGGDGHPTRTAAAAGRDERATETKEKVEPKPEEQKHEDPPQPPPTAVVLPGAAQAADGWQTPPEAAGSKPDGAEAERERARAEAEAAAEREAERERSASRSGGHRPRNKRGFGAGRASRASRADFERTREASARRPQAHRAARRVAGRDRLLGLEFGGLSIRKRALARALALARITVP